MFDPIQSDTNNTTITFGKIYKSAKYDMTYKGIFYINYHNIGNRNYNNGDGDCGYLVYETDIIDLVS